MHTIPIILVILICKKNCYRIIDLLEDILGNKFTLQYKRVNNNLWLMIMAHQNGQLY